MFKKISAFFVMMLFMVGMIPIAFGADTVSLTSVEPTAAPAGGASVEKYIKENPKEADISNLDKCVIAVKKKFPKLLDVNAKEYCLKAKKLKSFKENLGVSEGDKDVLAKVPAKYYKKVGSLEKADIEKLVKLEPAKIEKIASLSRSEIKSIVKDKRTLEAVDVEASIKEKQDFKKKALAVRNVSKAKLVATAKSIKESDEFYVSAKENLKKVSVDFAGAKKNYEACVGDSSEKCVEARKILALNSKEYLNNLADMIIENVRKVRFRAQGSEKLTDEQVEDILERGAVLIESVETLKEKIDGIHADTSKEGVREVANSVKAEFKNVKKFVEKVKSLMQERIVASVLVKFDALENRLERVLDKMEEEGMETTKIDELLDQFSENIYDARVNYKEGLKAQEDDSETAMEYFGYSKDLFNDAKTALGEIVKIVKGEGGWQILKETPEEEPELEAVSVGLTPVEEVEIVE